LSGRPECSVWIGARSNGSGTNQLHGILGSAAKKVRHVAST